MNNNQSDSYVFHRWWIRAYPHKCVGCRSCEVACSLFTENVCNPLLSRIRLKESYYEQSFAPVVCIQCREAKCIEACPNNALSREPERGVVIIDQEACNLCGACTYACPYNAIWINEKRQKLIKCDLCEGKPKCVELCQPGALSLEVGY